MIVHLIQPTHFTDPVTRRLFKTNKLSVTPLTLPYLAALLPEGTEPVITDEKTKDIAFDIPCDCVFITVWTINSLRAYEIADVYRKKRVPVVMGGPHSYFNKEEILKHADSAAIGEGEMLIPQIFDDLNKGKLKSLYESDGRHDLAGLPYPRRDIIDPGTLRRSHAVTVQISRGCPNSCCFCAERFYLGHRYRLRPVDEVIEEIKIISMSIRQILFDDSNFAAHRSRTLELMDRLVPFRLRWSALLTADRILDREFMKIGKKSGLLHANIGIESLSGETLQAMKKRTTKSEKIAEIIKILRDMDISFSLNFIFGWDTDKKDDLPATLHFLEKHRVHAAFFNILSPLKGTALYDEYLSAGRIPDPDNINRWPGLWVDIVPKNFTPGELLEGTKMLYRKFYSWPSMFRRLPLPLSKASAASWVINLSQLKMVSGKAEDFDYY